MYKCLTFKYPSFPLNNPPTVSVTFIHYINHTSIILFLFFFASTQFSDIRTIKNSISCIFRCRIQLHQFLSIFLIFFCDHLFYICRCMSFFDATQNMFQFDLLHRYIHTERILSNIQRIPNFFERGKRQKFRSFFFF